MPYQKQPYQKDATVTSNVKAPVGAGTDGLRTQLARRRAEMPLRELARRIGIARTALEGFLDSRPVRPSTVARIAAWVAEPGEDDVAARVRSDLRRLLVGRMGLQRARKTEGAIGRVLERAIAEAGGALPKWLDAFGAKEV